MGSITIDEFCKLHRLSRGGFYLLQKQGAAPPIFRIGRHVRISEEAAREWLAMREGKSIAANRPAEGVA